MIYRFGEFEFNEARATLFRMAVPHPEEVGLTQIESRVLLLLLRRAVSQPGIPYTGKDLCHDIWPNERGSEDSMRHHVKSLRGKLGNQPDGVPYLARNSYQLKVQVIESPQMRWEAPNTPAE